LQLPQSTVSRHLKVLAGLGLVQARGQGTSNWYRMPLRELDPAARRLWQALREEVAGTAAARRDASRLRAILVERHGASQRFFASAAGRWDKLRSELFGPRVELLAIPGLLDPGWTVGDLGCGTGHFAAALAPFVHRVVGIDESAAMLKSARARTRELANVELRSGSLEEPPLAPGELDAAVLLLVLHHAADPARVLAAARRGLKEGGRLLVVDMLPHERVEYRARMGHQWLGFAEAELAGWLESAGYVPGRAVQLPPDRQAKGPPLFALGARAGRIPTI
jgi:ArsR family transcriptional regulator